MATKTATKQKTRVETPAYFHAPYWEDDSTMNPTLVRFISQGTGEDRDFYLVKLPDGTEKWVHLHTLGKWH